MKDKQPNFKRMGKTWIDTSSKKDMQMPKSSWKCDQYQQSADKCKLKPQWSVIQTAYNDYSKNKQTHLTIPTTGEHTGILTRCWWKCKVAPSLGKALWHFHIKLNILSAYDPAVPLLCTYPREMKTYTHKKTGSSIFMAELIETENRLVVARGRGGAGGWEWGNGWRWSKGTRKKEYSWQFYSKIDKNKKHPKCPSKQQIN